MKQPNKTDSNKNAENTLQLQVMSWNQVYDSLLGLAKKIQSSGFEPDVIVGVSRGGWVPARILSDLLENSSLGSVETKFYVGVNETKTKPEITQEISVSVENKKVLLVDDLVDTGESIKLVISHLIDKGAVEVRTATLYRKPWSVVVPDYVTEESSCWLVFPWDHKETVRKLFEKFKAQGQSVDDIKEKLISFGLNKKIINQISEEKH